MVTSKIERDDINVISIPAGDMAVELGEPRAANTIVMGAIIGITGLVSGEAMMDSLDRKSAAKPDKVRETNKRALDLGIEYAKKYL